MWATTSAQEIARERGTLPAQLRDDAAALMQTVVAFLAEKERRSGSRRTVEGYARHGAQRQSR
jgi:hypothetical protein